MKIDRIVVTAGVVCAIKIVSLCFLFDFPAHFLFANITRTTLLNMVNQAREAQGVEGLRESEKLNQTATLKARDMLENGYFAHTSPEGKTPWHWFLQTGYNYKYAGENLAIGFFESEEVFNAWLDSPLHRQNILSPHYKEIGMAVVKGNFRGNNVTVVVQEFGAQGAREAPGVDARLPNEQVKTSLNVKLPVVAGAWAIRQDLGLSRSDLYSRVANFIFYGMPMFMEYILIIPHNFSII